MRRLEILLAVVAVAAVLAAPSLAGAQTLGLVAYWPLSETSGATAYDATGNGHNATVVATDLAGDTDPPTPGAPGLFGYAWQFYGTETNVSTLEVDNTTGLVGDQGSLDLSFNVWLKIPFASSDPNMQPRPFEIEQ